MKGGDIGHGMIRAGTVAGPVMVLADYGVSSCAGHDPLPRNRGSVIDGCGPRFSARFEATMTRMFSPKREV
jgi:hypothetical protein